MRDDRFFIARLRPDLEACPTSITSKVFSVEQPVTDILAWAESQGIAYASVADVVLGELFTEL